jgi:hypothetical protein
MNRAKDLQQNEDDTDQDERTAKALAVPHGGNQKAHHDRKGRRQDASQQQHRPPRNGETGVRSGQDAEKFPFLAPGQGWEHSCILP